MNKGRKVGLVRGPRPKQQSVVVKAASTTQLSSRKPAADFDYRLQFSSQTGNWSAASGGGRWTEQMALFHPIGGPTAAV